MRIRSQSDFWCGLLFVAIGVAVLVAAASTASAPPRAWGRRISRPCSAGCWLFLGLTLTIPALFKDGEKFPRLHWRPLAMVLLSIAAFGVTLEYLGFAIAVAVLVVIGGLADPDLRPIEAAGLAVFLVLFSIGIFVGLLGLPLNLWPSL